MRHVCLVWILLIGMLPCKTSMAQSLRFKQISSELGAPLNGIETILQDYKGFLWLGTWAGLAKFDGYSIKMYSQEPGHINGLRSNKITTIFEDSKQRLWIGTNFGGFYLYNRDNDIFIPYLNDPSSTNSVSDNNVSAIIEDDEGVLWIGTENGLNQFQPETETFTQYFPQPNDLKSLENAHIHSLKKSPAGEIWIGTHVGLNRLVKNAENDSVTFVRYDLAPSNASCEDLLRHNFIQTICPSKYNPQTLWIGTGIGLKKVLFSASESAGFSYTTFEHDPKTKTGLSHSIVTELLEEDESHLWVATFNGLNLLDTKTETFNYYFSDKNNPGSLSNNVIKSLAKDRSGVFWIGSEKGVNWVNLKDPAFENIRLIMGENINTNFISNIVQAQSRNGLWIGTHGGGMIYVSLDSSELMDERIHFFEMNSPKVPELAGFISEIEVDSKGWMWVATQGAGLLKIKEDEISDSIKIVQQFTTENAIADNYLMSLNVSYSNDIWFGYWAKGLERYNPQNNSFQYFPFTSDSLVDLSEFPIVNIAEVQENGKAYLWIGRMGGGLLKLAFDPLSKTLTLVQSYQHDGKLTGNISNNFINSIHCEDGERIWVGTESGLNILDLKTNNFTFIRETDGLANSAIQSILGTKEDLWVSTQKGISHIQYVDGDFNIRNYDMYDGVPDNLFYAASAYLTSNGKKVFGGEHGLTMLQSENIFIDTLAPQVVITDFRLANQSVPIGPLPNGRTLLKKNISETKVLELTHEDQVISFEFVGLQFSKPEKIQYAFRLEGFDTDWVYTTADQRIAHYTNLPYKSFVFQVKAANADGIWSDPVSLQVIVLPPFWLTTWAYMIYLLLFLGVLYGALRIMQMRTEFRHQLELEKLEKEKMEEVNKMKLQFFTNISHELKTPLTLIISPLEQYIKEQSLDKKFYRSVTRMHYNANRLLTMINQLLDIRKSEAGLMKLKVAEGNIVKFVNELMISFKGLAKQSEISLKFHSNSPKILVWYDRDQMEKVMFNLLTNAIKFTNEGGEILINLSVESEAHSENNSFLQISVKDTGVGIPQNQLSHIFDRFYQVEKNEESSRKGGAGIGLALSKSIVESHSGKIWAESIENEGTTIFISLPLGDAHFSDDEKISGFQNSERISQYVMPPITENGRNSLHDLFDKGFADRDKPAVLIVEDNADIRDYLRENLEAFFQVAEAVDGIEGWEKAEEKSPDLILADISMPRMDGIELCEKVKSNIATSHIPIILLTARTSLVFKIDGLETGADDYITKPFNMRLLATRIKNLIESRKNLQEKFSQNMGLNPNEVTMNSLDEKFLSQIKVVLEKNLGNASFSVENLAESINMSRMQMYRKLKSLTGHTPNKIIRSYRLKKAAQLLKTGHYNVSEVTYMVGYNDLKSFREQFKKEFGVNPSGYEK